MGGQKRFRMMIDSFVKGAAGLILATDNKKSSYEELDKLLILGDKSDTYLGQLPAILVRTKNDLAFEEGLSIDDLKNYATSRSMIGVYQTSAKEGNGIHPKKKTFDGLMDLLKAIDEKRSTAVQPDRGNDFDSGMDYELSA